MEFVRRRSLEQEHTTLPGFHPENKQKMADTPTAERLLKAFADVSLTIIKHATGEEILRRLTPLSRVQEAIPGSFSFHVGVALQTSRRDKGLCSRWGFACPASPTGATTLSQGGV